MATRRTFIWGAADDAHRTSLQPLAGIAGERFERGLGHYQHSRTILRAKALPAENLEHSGANAVRPPGVPVVVEPQYRHPVSFEKGPFRGVHRVGGEGGGGVLVIIEGGLVSDDEVAAGLGRALQHVEGGHHGGGDPLHRCIGRAGLQRVDRRRAPRDPEVFLYPFDHLAYGER